MYTWMWWETWAEEGPCQYPIGVTGPSALPRNPRPATVMSKAHAMILPTRYDASANACLEAMACGVPVVTTRCNKE